MESQPSRPANRGRYAAMHRPTLIVFATMMFVGCGSDGATPIDDLSTQSPATDHDPTPVESPMSATLVATDTLNVGSALVVEGPSPSSDFVTVFEDDGDTGYFYGLDTTREDNPIVDALHIYNAKDVSDRDKPSSVQIVWSSDGLKSALLINNCPHAVFDFQAQRGYCRTGFPPPDKNWTNHLHDWDDAASDLFK